MADNWFVGRDGNRQGPVSAETLRRMAASGQLSPSDLVWREGMSDWAPAGAIRGVFPGPGEPLVPGVAPNPYASPAATDPWPHEASPGDSIRYAEYLPRVGAALLDGIFLFLMQCVPGALVGVFFAVLAGDDPDAQAAGAAVAQLFSSAIGMVISVIYYVTLESSLKQGTWGKQIVGIKVTDMNGNRITAGRALGRWAAHILTGCTCGIGYLMPLFNDKKQTLHDMLAGCLALAK